MICDKGGTMTTVFSVIVKMSLRASALIAVIFLLRCFFSGFPRRKTGSFYVLTAVLLLVPLSFRLPAVPGKEDGMKTDVVSERSEKPAGSPAENSGVTIQSSTVQTETARTEPVSEGPENSGSPARAKNGIREAAEFLRSEKSVKAAAAVWLCGTFAMFAYLVISCFVIRRKLRTVTKMKDQVFSGEAVTVPFVFGIFRPRIYLPPCTENEELILLHEKMHLKRKDHLTKLFGWCVLSVHWFNPLVWLSYRMFAEDIEIACDEALTGGMSVEEKKTYARALVLYEVKRRGPVTGAAFAETGVKERINQMMKVKKRPGLVLPVLLLTMLLTAGLFTACDIRPEEKTETEGTEEKKETESTEETTETETQGSRSDDETESEATEPAAEESASGQAAYTDEDRENDLKTKDDRLFVDGAYQKFIYEIQREIGRRQKEGKFPEIYPEGYCGYSVDTDTNTVRVYVLEVTEDAAQFYLNMMPEKYRKYLRFEKRAWTVDLNWIYTKLETVSDMLSTEGLFMSWDTMPNGEAVTLSLIADSSYELPADKAVIEKKVRDIMGQYNFPFPYDITVSGPGATDPLLYFEDPDFEPEMVWNVKLRDEAAAEWLTEYMRMVGQHRQIREETRIWEDVKKLWDDTSIFPPNVRYDGKVEVEQVYIEKDYVVFVQVNAEIIDANGSERTLYHYILLYNDDGQWVTDKDVVVWFPLSDALDAIFMEAMNAGETDGE